MSTQILIKAITPIYNEYRIGVNKKPPVELLYLMWEIGSLLQKHVKTHDVAPHTLYRDIYGKADTAKNAKQKSYITREFLGRCYRVRNIFEKKEKILKMLPCLSAMSHFRESMPFFDNEKYKLEGAELKKLLEVINSTDLTNKNKDAFIKKLQEERIGKKNPRTQQLAKFDDDKTVFIEFYNSVYKVLKLRDFESAKNDLNVPDTEFISVLSFNCGAIAADGLQMKPFEVPVPLDERWKVFAKVIEKLIEKKNPLDRRRFRRLIPPKRLMRMSEMLYAFTSKEQYNRFKI